MNMMNIHQSQLFSMKFSQMEVDTNDTSQLIHACVLQPGGRLFGMEIPSYLFHKEGYQADCRQFIALKSP